MVDRLCCCISMSILLRRQRSPRGLKKCRIGICEVIENVKVSTVRHFEVVRHATVRREHRRVICRLSPKAICLGPTHGTQVAQSRIGVAP